MAKNSMLAIEMESIDSATFTGNYQAINVGGLTEPCSIIRIINDSDRDIVVSYDGVLDNDFVGNGDHMDLNFQTNSQPNNKVAKMAQGTVVYVAGLAGGTGLIYLAGYYQPV